MTAALKKTSINLQPQPIDWNKSAKAFEERLRHSIEYLQFRARAFNAITACETIGKFVAEQQKYLLFRQMFPEEWKNSRTSLFKPGFYENYTERTNEFFGLVNDRLFPLLVGWYEEPEAEFDIFNIFSLNIDFCCDEVECEYLQISYVAALLIFSYDEDIWDYWASNYGLQKEDFPTINQKPFETIWDLEKTGRTGLYLNIFEVVDHSTGNPWLDATNCRYGENYSWDEETVEFLSRTFNEAKEMLQKTELLDKLIVANPKEILGEMIALWNTGKIPNEQTSGRRKVKKRLPKADE